MKRIFYSWQNDLKPNRVFIGDCLAAALADTDWEIETATRDAKGAVDIADAIIEKIDHADAFLADVSIIGEVNGKKVSNPNVMYELGYAAKVLGWDKIILVGNKNTTPETRHLPFDIMTRLALLTNMTKDDKLVVAKELKRIILDYNITQESLSKPYIFLDRYSSGPMGTQFRATNDEAEAYVLTSIELGAVDVRFSRNLPPKETTANINAQEISERSLEHPLKTIRFTVNRLNESFRITQRIQLEPRADGRFNFQQIEPTPMLIEKVPVQRRQPIVESVAWNGDGVRVKSTDSDTDKSSLITISSSLLASMGSLYGADTGQYAFRIANAINDYYKGLSGSDFNFTTFNTNESFKLEELVDSILEQGAEMQKVDKQ
jgi:hypothetical protein